MTSRQFFIHTFNDELPRFERVFKALAAVPLKKLTTYRPNRKSRSAFEIVKLFGGEGTTFGAILKHGIIDFAKPMPKSPNTVIGISKFFIKSSQDSIKQASRMNDKQWEENAQMVMGEHVDWETTKGNMVWALLLDLIHHRGQLSVYLRPVGGKVPSIYGPSADTK